MKVNFDAVFYYVSDLEKSIPFYRDVLGFQFVSQDAVARFHIGGVLFEVVPTENREKLRGRGNARLCLKVDDINAALAELQGQGIRTGEAAQKENGILASFRDPDGNEICLWQYTS